MRALMLSFVFSVPVAAVAVPQSIAVMPAEAARAGLDEAGRATLDQSIRASTVESVAPLGFSVAGEGATKAAVEASKPSLTSTCDERCAQAAAEKLGADYLVSGTTTQTEGEYTTFLELHDRAGRQLGALEVSGGSLREMRGELARQAPTFFSRSLAPVAEGTPVPATPVTPVPAPEETGPVVRLQPEDHDAKYTVDVFAGGQTFTCEETVTWLQPCELRGLPAGPAQIHVRGSAKYSQDVMIPPGGGTFRLWHKPYDVLYVGIAGVGVGTALLVAPDVGGFPDAAGAPALRTAGALIGVAGLTLMAVDLFDTHNGARRAPDEHVQSWIHFDSLRVSRTAGGALFTARGRF